MDTITLPVPPELARALPSDPALLSRVLALGLEQWQADNLPQLERLYAFRRPAEVKQFLVAHPDLVEALQAAYPYLQACFGPGVQVALELVNDPEVEKWQTLFVYISCSLPVAEAMTCLGRFDDEWLNRQPDRVQNDLAFNLEFV